MIDYRFAPTHPTAIHQLHFFAIATHTLTTILVFVYTGKFIPARSLVLLKLTKNGSLSM